MHIYILSFLFLLTSIQFDSLDITPIAQVTIGDKRNDIHIDDFQRGVYFTIDENECFWLSDYENRQIKAFNNKGKLLYIINPENISASIEKLHIYDDYLIALKSDGVLYFYNKYEGKLLARKKLTVEHAIFNKAYFNGQYLFLPQFGSPFPNENLYEFLIEIKKPSEQTLSISVDKLNLIMNAYNSDKKNNNYLPIEDSCYSTLKDIFQLSFKGQSKDYILIMNYSGPTKEEDGYYIFLKKNQLLKKIGKFPESITGIVDNSWWGEASVIIGNHLYLMGVKYKDDNPKNIVISKVSLSNINKLTTVSVEEILVK